MKSQKELEKEITSKLSINPNTKKEWKQLMKPPLKIGQKPDNPAIDVWQCGSYNAAAFLTTMLFNSPVNGPVDCRCYERLITELGIDETAVRESAVPAFESGLLCALRDQTYTDIAAVFYYIIERDFFRCKTDTLSKALSILEDCGWSPTSKIEESVEIFEKYYVDAGIYYANEMVIKAAIIRDGIQKIADEMKERIKESISLDDIASLKSKGLFPPKNWGDLTSESEWIMQDANEKAARYIDENSVSLFTAIGDEYKARNEHATFRIGIGWLYSFINGNFFHKNRLGMMILSHLILSSAPFLPERGQPGGYECEFDFPTMEELEDVTQMLDEEEYVCPADYYECEADEHDGGVIPILAFMKPVSVRIGGNGHYERGDCLVSRMAGVDFTGIDLAINKRFMAILRAGGLSKKEARDLAVAAAVLKYKRCFADPAHPALSRALSEGATVAELQAERCANCTAAAQASAKATDNDEIDKLRKQIRGLESDLKDSRHQLAEKKREIASLTSELDEARKLNDAYARELSGIDEEDTHEDSSVKFPFDFNEDVVIYGGFPKFQAALSKLMPNVRFVQHTSSAIDPTPLRNADIIFLQTNFMSHGAYWDVCGIAKNYNIPYYHLNYASAKLCAEFMVEKINEFRARKKQENYA